MKDAGRGFNKFTLPNNLTILTARNKGSLGDRIIPHLLGYEDVSILEQNLEYLGVNLVVLTDNKLPWRNTVKIKMIYEYLQSGKCDTELFMYCDAIDVIFVDYPQRVIDIFEESNCDVLFMSTHSTDGYQCMPHVKVEVDVINNGNGRYLNSGVYIGKTEFITEIFEELIKYVGPNDVTMSEYYEYLASNPIDYPRGSQDQDLFRYLEPKFYPRLKVDYLNKMAWRS